MSSHQDRILDQFSRQAAPFATAPGIRAEEALRLVVELTGAGPGDTSLDVACGPGLLVCAFAKVVRHATGIDLTPAMLDRAREEARGQGLSNVTWDQGDVTTLPYRGGSFTIVTSRFAFHHLLDPLTVLREMHRVCVPGGRVAVIDSAPEPDKADAFNHMEKLRDPSHVRAMPMGELQGLFRAVGLPAPRTATYRLEGDLDGLLARSFPHPGDDVKIRRLFEASLTDDRLGISPRRDGDLIRYAYPVAVLVATR